VKMTEFMHLQENSKETQDSEVATSDDVQLLLPVFLNLKDPDLNTISSQTVQNLILSKFLWD
jgi:hypothetical protein